MIENSEETREWYKGYYERKGKYRNDLLRNPEVLFQALASEVSLVKAIRIIEGEKEDDKLLDVGCGSGGNLFQLIRLGYKASNISGVDIQEENIEKIKDLYPQANFYVCDASKMQFGNNTFDLVYESTVFSILPDDTLCKSIADEMIRVCKVGGYILLIDWRIPKPNNPNYNALTKKKLKNFFNVGTQTKLITMEKGALIPPIGRFLSKNIPSIYFLVCRIFPFLVGQVAYLLRKDNEIIMVNKEKQFSFYNRDTENSTEFYYPENLIIWKPSLSSIFPPSLNKRFLLWSIMHFLHLFSTKDYSIVYIKRNSRIVHRSCVIPRYFRWRFMSRNDLQVTSTWTHPDFRGKGLAPIALEFITKKYYQPSRKIWYITRNANIPSIKVCLKVGFKFIGSGVRINRFGFKIFGQFLIQNKVTVGNGQKDGHGNNAIY
jgi:ubiquinone/menaquinone biosynthesis C-methylase UbiE/GNAT superfamily N-acetyltransferase